MSDVMTFCTITGEIIGRLKEETDTSYVVENPRLFGHGEQGVGFVPGVCLTGKRDPVEATLNKSMISCVIETEEQIVKAWQQQTSGIVIP